MFAIIAQLTATPVTTCAKLNAYRYVTTEVNILHVLPNPALTEGILTVNTAVDAQGHFCITFTAIATLTAAVQNCRVYDMSPDILLLAKYSISV